MRNCQALFTQFTQLLVFVIVINIMHSLHRRMTGERERNGTSMSYERVCDSHPPTICINAMQKLISGNDSTIAAFVLWNRTSQDVENRSDRVCIVFIHTLDTKK